MAWSSQSAANTHLDTIKLCKNEHESRSSDPSLISVQPENRRFISEWAAAGTSAQLMVDISPKASHSAIALPTAARQNSGRQNVSYEDVVNMIDMNPKKSVVVANSLKARKEGLSMDMRDAKVDTVPVMGRNVSLKKDKDERTNAGAEKRRHLWRKVRWVKKIDEKSGEEHLYRVAKPI